MKRTPIKKLGKRGKMNKKANAILAKIFLIEGTTWCEVCGSKDFLTWAHRSKRRFYRSVEELADPYEVLLLCGDCHREIEYDKEATEKLFKRLR